MAWGTPTITRQRGRVYEHTYVTAEVTLEGTDQLTLALDDMPLAVIGGIVQARSNSGTENHGTTIYIRNSNSFVGALGDSNTYTQAITVSASPPDYWNTMSMFTNMPVSGTVNYMQYIPVFPSNEWLLAAYSDNVAATTETVNVYIGMVSYVMDLGDRTA